MKSDKITYIIYTDIESLIKKIDECANNPENSSATNIGEHIPSGYSMSTIWAFDNIETRKIGGRLYQKVLWIFKRTREEYNWSFFKCYH